MGSMQIDPGRRYIANRIRLYRREIGYAQPEFARRCRIPLSRLENIEHGRTDLTAEEACRIAAAFHESLDRLFYGLCEVLNSRP